MVRDPTSAHAYWDLGVDCINVALGPHDRRRAFLRLIGVPTGYLRAEYAVPAERGSQAVALPEAGGSYMVELAVMRNYQWVVLARSNVIHAPPAKARVASAPAFVSRAEQLRLLAESRDREPDRAAGDPVAAPTTGVSHVGQAGGPPASRDAPARIGVRDATALSRLGAPPRFGVALRPGWVGGSTHAARAGAHTFRHVREYRNAGPGGCRTRRACRGCVAWTRPNRRAPRRKQPGQQVGRRGDPSWTGGSDPRPSGAGRCAARAGRFTYVLIRQGGVHGERESRWLHYGHRPGRELHHVQSGAFH